jgi:hypothetical protein
MSQMANNPLITFFSNLNTTNNEDPEANGNNPLITFFSNLTLPTMRTLKQKNANE